jgi:hypothetical protein
MMLEAQVLGVKNRKQDSSARVIDATMPFMRPAGMPVLLRVAVELVPVTAAACAPRKKFREGILNFRNKWLPKFRAI